MPGHDNIAVPHADRYGHPEAVNLMTLTPGSYDHGVTAPHCDRYGHVEGNDPTILHLRWPRTNPIILLDGEDGAISEWNLAVDPTHVIIAVNELQVRYS